MKKLKGLTAPARSLALRLRKLGRSFWRSVKGSRFGRWLQRSWLWKSPVVQSAAGTLLALTVAGIISPPGLVKGAADALYETVTPGPSASERAVNELYSDLYASSHWRFYPSMSAESRKFLIAHWDDHRADEIRPFEQRGAVETTVGEMFTDYGLDARPIRLRAFVSQVFHTTRAEEGKPLLAGFRLGIGGEDEVAWCGQTAFPRGQPPEVDQLVEVRGIIIARGSANTTSGGFQNGTFLVCSAVRQLSSAESSREVGALFRRWEDDSLWMATPSMSARARMQLLRNWDEMNPYKPHRFPRRELRSVGIDQVHEDTRFDNELLWVAGRVTQRLLTPAGPGLTTEHVRLEVDWDENAIWCQTTVKHLRVFQEGELVEAVGVPIARGSVQLTAGGFQNQTAMACPAMRRI